MPAPVDPFSDFVNGTVADGDKVDARFLALYRALDKTQVGLDAASIQDGIITPGLMTTATAQSLIQTGTVLMTAAAAADAGFLLCNGSAVSRATYAALYAKLGGAASAWGQGDGVTTFNVPDLRGRAPVGVGTGTGGGASGTGLPAGGSALTARALAAWLGEENHTLSISEIPSHNHAGSAFLTSSGTHYAFATGAAGPELAFAFVISEGGGGSHNTVQPVIALNFQIKT